MVEAQEDLDLEMFVHICRWHSLRFLSEKFKKCYSNLDSQTRKKVLDALHPWIEGYVRGKDLWSFCSRVKNIILVIGSKYATKEVKEAIKRIGDRTDRKGK